METRAEPTLEFKSKEEFRATCHRLAMRMHYLNRVAMGESNFTWEVADMLERLGRVFETHNDDPEVSAAFGDGWTKGTLSSDDARRALLFKLLYDDA